MSLDGPVPRRLSALAALAPIALASTLLAPACTARTGEVEPRYVAVHNAFSAMGLVAAGPIQRGSLAEGREARFPLELAAQCTTVVVLGSPGVVDVDAVLLDADDRPVARDATRDAEAAVRACPEKAGRFTLVVKMTKGAGDFVAGTWSGGAGPAGAVAPVASAPIVSPGAGTCSSPIAIGAGLVIGSTRRGESEHTGGCGQADGKELVYKIDVPRRQRLVADVDGQFDTVLYVRKDECEDSEAEVACNDDAPTGKGKASNTRASRIDEVVDPGTYYVFVDGFGSNSGNFRMSLQTSDVPSLADACRQARPLGATTVNGALTASSYDNGRASCADHAKGPDVIHRLDVPIKSRVRVVEHATDFGPVVHVRRACADDRSEVGCSDSGARSDEAVFVGTLDAGSYTVFADATDRAAQGRYTIDVDTAPPVGVGVPGDACADALPITTSEKAVTGDTFSAKDDFEGKCAGAGAPDVVYRFELPRRARVTTHFTGEEGNHVFALLRDCTDRKSELACSGAIDEVLAPGTYYLIVDGAREEPFGRFTFSVQARDTSAQEAACRAPQLLASGQKINGTTTGGGDKFTTSCAGREDQQASPDRVYRIQLAARSKVRLSLSTPTWDGVLALRRACLDPPQMRGARAIEAACNNDDRDNRHAKIETTLDPGAYFVVVDGHAAKNEGAFTLEYEATIAVTAPVKPK